MTTARLLERWRNHEEGRHLGKLAAVELPVSDDFDASAELEQCIAQLALAGNGTASIFLLKKKDLTHFRRRAQRAAATRTGVHDQRINSDWIRSNEYT